uniref:hypothetical protein n=1 Tax=Vibrio sp. TaxID=678 RepID=UPI001F1C22BE|nr:hypothetical protein [Vibrio sp.]
MGTWQPHMARQGRTCVSPKNWTNPAAGESARLSGVDRSKNTAATTRHVLTAGLIQKLLSYGKLT